MRIDYLNYPNIDQYKNVRYITDSFVDNMKKCEEKIQKFAFNIESQDVVYIYSGLFMVCSFSSSDDGWVRNATMMVYVKGKLIMDVIFDEDWQEKLTEEESGLLYLCAAFSFFIDCAEVDTIYLDKKSGITHGGVKYSNSTNKNVKIYDSTWLNNIVMSESFSVRGHFRLQPCGSGLQKRKLIWVSDFTKYGYTRRAGKELEKSIE